MRVLIACLLLVLLVACAKEPFAPEPMQVLHSPHPREMRDSFARTLPNRFTSDETIIIQAPFHDDLAVLGVLRVDRPAGTFELIALNHIGLKLFEMRGDRNGVSLNSTLQPVLAQKTVLLWIGRDIQQIYLDLLPPDDARTEIESKDVLFRKKGPAGTVVYKFGGDPAILLEKRLVGFFGTIWRIRYFRYTEEDAGLYPRGIVLDNERYHYRLIVKHRDAEIDP